MINQHGDQHRTFGRLIDDIESRIIDHDERHNDYSGDIYGIDLDRSLPRTGRMSVFSEDEAARAPLWQSELFVMPGGKNYASGAHHQHPLHLGVWSGSRARSYSDGYQNISSLFLAWDHDVNGPPEAFYSHETCVVSARCVTTSVREGQRFYTVRHRYRMPVRMLIKGFRCPACTVERIQTARRGHRLTSRWAQTLDSFPHVVRDWDKDRNWPVKIEHVPAIRDLFVDMRCHICGYWRINFADLLAGTDRAPQGCARCRRTSVSTYETVLRDVMAHFAQPGVLVRSQHPVGNYFIDIALSTSQSKIALEYDGSYWHEPTYDRDLRKTSCLLRDGWTVMRLRKPLTEKHGLRDIPGAINLPTSEKSAATVALDGYIGVRMNAPGVLRDASGDEILLFAKELEWQLSVGSDGLGGGSVTR